MIGQKNHTHGWDPTASTPTTRAQEPIQNQPPPPRQRGKHTRQWIPPLSRDRQLGARRKAKPVLSSISVADLCEKFHTYTYTIRSIIAKNCYLKIAGKSFPYPTYWLINKISEALGPILTNQDILLVLVSGVHYCSFHTTIQLPVELVHNVYRTMRCALQPGARTNQVTCCSKSCISWRGSDVNPNQLHPIPQYHIVLLIGLNYSKLISGLPWVARILYCKPVRTLVLLDNPEAGGLDVSDSNNHQTYLSLERLDDGNGEPRYGSGSDLQLLPEPPKTQKKVDIKLLKDSIWDLMDLENGKKAKNIEKFTIKILKFAQNIHIFCK
ncbi:unnamed protein product, partial [Nesidiocoris tenuis]